MPEAQKVIRETHTACLHCVFARWEDKTQTGCSLGRICAFHDEDEESVVEARDDEREFYVISGRKCRAFRKEDWAKGREDPKADVRREIAAQVALVVPIHPDGVTRTGLRRTAKSVVAQSTPFSCAFFVNNLAWPVASLNEELYGVLGNTITWRIIQVHGEARPDGECIDMAVSKLAKSTTHYSVFRPGPSIPSDFVRDVDRTLNDLLWRWSVLRPDSRGNALTVQLAVHNHPEIGGNQPVEYGDEGGKVVLSSLLKKVERFAIQQNNAHFITGARKVCKALR